jgi:hypothetical protein
LRLWCLTPKYQFVSALSNDAKAIGRDAHARYRTVESYELGSPALSVGRSETICAIIKS